MRLFPSEHAEHAVGHQKTADNVNCRKDDGGKSKPGGQLRVLCTSRQQGSDHGNPRYGVGTGHEWCVQRRWDLGNDLEADEYGQHKYSQCSYQGFHVSLSAQAVAGVR